LSAHAKHRVANKAFPAAKSAGEFLPVTAKAANSTRALTQIDLSAEETALSVP
jgi:hypothetical protein